MTETPGGAPEPQPPVVPPTVPVPATPLAPKVPTLIVILILAALIGYVLRLDTSAGNYVAFGSVGLMAGVLGVDISRFWRGEK